MQRDIDAALETIKHIRGPEVFKDITVNGEPYKIDSLESFTVQMDWPGLEIDAAVARCRAQVAAYAEQFLEGRSCLRRPWVPVVLVRALDYFTWDLQGTFKRKPLWWTPQ